MHMLRYVVLLFVLLFSPAASPQAIPLTGLAIQGALSQAIGDLQNALHGVTNDLQSLGNSLQANAQNVIADMDRVLGSKINLTFDRLDATELRLVEDAQALLKQMQVATQSVLKVGGAEARLTLVQADITAYNTTHSLPCRSAPPRVLVSFPAKLTARHSPRILQLKGNFLRQGNISATVNGTAATILSRLDNELSVEIPESVIQAVKDDDVYASVQINGLESVRRAPRLWGLFGCGESRSLVNEKPLALTIIEPPYSIALAGSSRFEYTATREVAEAVQPIDNTGSSRCDDNYRVDRTYCVSGNGTLANTVVSNISANCSSSYEGTTPAGDRCVLVRGKVAGCGAVRGPFNAWLGCNGRGWLRYNIQLVRREPYQAATENIQFAESGAPGTWSFNVSLPPSTGLEAAQARYTVAVNLMKGRRIVQTTNLSHANPNSQGITSRVNGGVLAVDVDPTALSL